MIYRILADVVLIVHFAFIVFATAGGFLLFRWRRVVWLHLPAVLWGVYIEITGDICPLTPLENGLRRLGGEAGYRGGFIDHYIGSVVYPDEFTREKQAVLLTLLLIVNGAAYTLFLRRSRRE